MSLMAVAQSSVPTAPADDGLRFWHSHGWRAVRRAVYLTLLDMTVFPELNRDGDPLPNALRQSAVEHGLIDAVTSRPTERLLRLNPGLRQPGESR